MNNRFDFALCFVLFMQRMCGRLKSTKKLIQNQAETKQTAANRIAVDAASQPTEPSTSTEPMLNALAGGTAEHIRMRRNNIAALRSRIMRNIKKGINNDKVEKDRMTLIKLEADLVKALSKSLD